MDVVVAFQCFDLITGLRNACVAGGGSPTLAVGTCTNVVRNADYTFTMDINSGNLLIVTVILADYGCVVSQQFSTASVKFGAPLPPVSLSGNSILDGKISATSPNAITIFLMQQLDYHL